MVTKHNYNGLTWIDIESPTKEDAKQITEEYSIDTRVAKEILSPTLKPKVDLFENFIFLVLHFPAFKHSHKKGNVQEIDFLIGRNFIITARYDAVDSLYNFSKIFEVNSILNKEKYMSHAGFIFFAMLKEMYASLLDELSAIEDSLSDIESEVFKGNEKKMVFEISKVSKSLLDFKKAVAMHKDVLSSLETAGREFFENNFSYYLRSMVNEYYKVDSMLRSNFDNLAELRETNNTLLQTKQNEVMKNFTILAFITFPLSLVVAILGLNTKSRPIIGQENDFWIILGGIAAIICVMFIYFRYRKWL